MKYEGDFLGEYLFIDNAYSAIRIDMIINNFSPDVWMRGDPGGWNLITNQVTNV